MTADSPKSQPDMTVESKSAATPKLSKPSLQDVSDLDLQALLTKAAKQVYFYFSDSNLPIDKYFFSLTVCNDEGWVPIQTIMTFKRMREFEQYGVGFIAYALQEEIETDGTDPLLAISEDGQNVRRKRPLQANATAWLRSVYVKGFGEGDLDTNSQEKLEEWFRQFGTINAVRKRRADGNDSGRGKGRGNFKGSCFVEFASETEMTKFLELKDLKFTDGETLITMSKDAYVQMKAKEKGISVDSLHRNNTGSTGRSTSAPSEKGANGSKKPTTSHKFNAFREMERLRKGGVPALADIPDSVAIVGKRHNFSEMGKKRERDSDADDEVPVPKASKLESFTIEYRDVKLQCDRATGHVLDSEKGKIPFEDNAVIRFVGAGPGADWKDLKSQVSKHGIEKPFLAFPPGSTSGSLAKTDCTVITDAEMQKLQDTKMLFGGVEVEWQRMSEDEQRDFWHTRANFQGKVALGNLESEPPTQKHNGHDHRGRGNRSRGGRSGKDSRGARGGARGKRQGGRDLASNGGLPPVVATGPADS